MHTPKKMGKHSIYFHSPLDVWKRVEDEYTLDLNHSWLVGRGIKDGLRKLCMGCD
jgi:hypothetical protein